jgi:integrase
MVKSTRSHPPDKSKKPVKPYEGYPLFAHNNGLWAKKIRGRLHYFGVWADPQAALNKYLEQRDDLHAGRTPRDTSTTPGLTIRQLCNKFLTAREHKLHTGQLSPHSFREYHSACERIVDTFGRDVLVTNLRPADFERLQFSFPETWGPVRRGKMIQLIRTIFAYAFSMDLIDRPVKYGSEFKRPTKATLRIHKAGLKARNGDRMFHAQELRRLIAEAKGQFQAILLLAANTGFGNSDIARLPRSAVDLQGGWVDFPRPKTGVARRCPLWPETIAALREAMAKRPAARKPEDEGLMFLTKYGQRWVKIDFGKDAEGKVEVSQDDAISKELRKLLRKLGIVRRGLGFYGLRHGFQTVGEEVRDAAAVHFLMGHAEDAGDMSAHYREHISDERLRVVTEHIRRWLFVGPWKD